MPGSFLNFDDVVQRLVAELQPTSFLDIGCGYGKYGKLVRATVPHCRRTGIEIEASYVEQFALADLYDEVEIADAWSLLRDRHTDYYDLCIIGDCIEHMPKSVGLDLLNLLTYRTQYLIVLAPEFSVQGAVNGVASESHVSVWSERDFTWHDRWAWDNCFTISLFVLRGYQPAPIDLRSLVERVNATGVQVRDFHGDRVLRPVTLKLQIVERKETIGDSTYDFRPA